MHKWTPYMFLLPYLCIFSIFWVVPVSLSIVLSMGDITMETWQWNNFSHWITLFKDPLYWKTLKNTFLIIFIQVPIMIFLATILANILSSPSLKLSHIHRFAIFAPIVVGEAVYAVIFRLVFNENVGPINKILWNMGLPEVQWITDSLGATILISIALTWRWTGYNTIIILAGLQNLSQEVHEASDLDGANTIQKFVYVTLPQLKAVILFCLVLSTIGTLQLFTEPTLLTKGGPGMSTTTISMYMYKEGFKLFNFGYASAIAYSIVIIALVASWIQFKILGKDHD